MSNSTLDEALKGEPPPEWTRRARAKDDLRERARELRVQGLDYEEIAGAVGYLRAPSRYGCGTCRFRSA